MGMEGTPKLTQEQIEMNRTRERVVEDVMARDGGARVNDRGDVEIVASEEVKSRIKLDMKNELFVRTFYENNKDMIGKDVNLVLTTSIDSASVNPPLRFPFMGNKEKNIKAKLKDISGVSVVLEYEGKELEVFAAAIKEMHPVD